MKNDLPDVTTYVGGLVPHLSAAGEDFAARICKAETHSECEKAVERYVRSPASDVEISAVLTWALANCPAVASFPCGRALTDILLPSHYQGIYRARDEGDSCRAGRATNPAIVAFIEACLLNLGEQSNSTEKQLVLGSAGYVPAVEWLGDAMLGVKPMLHQRARAILIASRSPQSSKQLVRVFNSSHDQNLKGVLAAELLLRGDTVGVPFLREQLDSEAPLSVGAMGISFVLAIVGDPVGLFNVELIATTASNIRVLQALLQPIESFVFRFPEKRQYLADLRGRVIEQIARCKSS